MTKVKSIFRQITAILKGDDEKVVGEKIYRRATSALKAQISTLEGVTVQLEDSLSEAKENAKLALINNAKLITNTTEADYYVNKLLVSENNITMATEALELHIKKIELLKAKLLELDEEVEA